LGSGRVFLCAMPPKKGSSGASGGGGGKPAAAAAVALPYMDDGKLRPIHKEIDAGHHKAATKLLVAALQKYGQQPVLRALQALIHAQQAEFAEARAVLAGLPPLREQEPRTFNTVLLVYRTMDDVPGQIRCHEHAVSLGGGGPQSEEQQTVLFFLHARLGDYARLQAAAMKLFTTFKKDKYLVWSAVNQLLARRKAEQQAQQQQQQLPGGAAAASNTAAAASEPVLPVPAAPAPDKLLQLLELMLSRTFGAPAFPRASMSSEELQVLLQVYLAQHKYTEAMRLLDSDAAAAFKEKDSTEFLRIRAQTLRDASAREGEGVWARLAESNAVYEELCRLNNDDWFFLTSLITGEVQLARKQQHPSATETPSDASPVLTFDARVAQLRAFLATQQAAVTQQGTGKKAGQPLKRGPFLAEAELEFQLWQAGSTGGARSSAPPAALTKALVNYFRHFGSKSCFYSDVLQYLEALDQSARSELATSCLNLIPSIVDSATATRDTSSSPSSDGPTSPPASEAEQVLRFQLSLSVQQMMRFNYSCTATTQGEAKSVAASVDLMQRGQSLFEQFLATTQLSSTRLRVPSERGLGDSFALLFAGNYLSQALATSDRRLLLDAILGLEVALLKHSPHNYQFKLWLIRLYCHPLVGALQRALALYKSLDIKQIQHDITAHLLLDDTLRYGHLLSDASPMCARLLNWHQSADREDVATSELAYTRASYTKVTEFVEFKERRQRSLARYTAALVTAHTGLLKLGVPLDKTTATTQQPADADSKDITRVHAYLKRVRGDLSKQYPSLSSASSTAECATFLVANNDYSVVSCWDAASAPLSTLLNRPAPALFASSFALPLGELLRPKTDDSHTWHIDTAHLQQLRFFRITFDLQWAMLEQDAPQLRKLLPALQQTLIDLRLLSDVSDASIAAEVLQSFDEQHWRLCVLIMDCAACVVESAAHTAAFLQTSATAAAASSADQVAELIVRWSSVQRQMALLAFNLDEMTKSIAARAFLTPASEGAASGNSSGPASSASAPLSEDARAVVYGDAHDAGASVSSQLRSADPRALRDAASLAQFGSLWLTLAVQVWAAGVPNKKAFKKAQQKKAQQQSAAATPAGEDGGDAGAAAADPLAECVLGVRAGLAALIKAQRASLHTLQAICKRLAGRAKEQPALLQPAPLVAAASAAAAPPAVSSSSAPSSAAYLGHRSSVRLLQSEHSAIVQAVLNNIDSSHGHTAAQLLPLFVACDAPLQQVKL